MRANRLVSIMMLLQARGRMTAPALARELEVSVRTIHRDIEELSTSGVPVVAERGAQGGLHLLDGWRTKLTGLTPKEAQALLAASVGPQVSELGLGEELAAARWKLLGALPAGWQEDAERVSSRMHVDPVGWYRRPGRADFLRAVAEAVWTERRVRLEYESWSGVVKKEVDPLGLVLKAGAFYLVARSGREPRTYRVASIRDLAPTSTTFRRPKGFDLAAYWAESTARFEREIYRGTAEVDATERGLRGLRALSAKVADAVDATLGAKRGEWSRVTIPIESLDHATREMIKLGAEVEVLEPPELRERVAGVAQQMAAMYLEPASRERLRRAP